MDAILETAISQYKYATDVWRDPWNEAIDDLKFTGGEQWDQQALEMRQGRPCLTINRLPSYVDQVVGDIRQNTPSIKIRPAGNGADEETAEIIEGIVRGIEYKSNADSVYESAAEQSISSSIGAYRILTQYVDDESFDQEIIIKRIKNQFTVTPDPDCIEPDFSDMKYCFVTEVMPATEFKAQFPGVEITQFQEQGSGEGEDYEGWYMEDKVRIAEYFRRVQKKGNIYLLTDGTVTDKAPAMKELIAKERPVTTYQVEWRKITGNKVLEGPITLDCSTIPIVMVMGKESNIAGKVMYRSLIRWAKTPQQIYNYMRSAHMEMTALAPKVPYVVTDRQIEGHEAQWQNANSQAYPYLVVNSTPDGLPKRTEPVTTHPGLVNEIMQSADEIKQTTALFDASRGQAQGQESGRAILALQNKGDIATLVFKDNLARAIRYGGRVILEMIPKVYDTQRILNIVKKDGSVDEVEVNKVDEITGEVLNNLQTGKYHCVVDTGPSYTTQRMEAAESQLQLIQAAPQLMGVIGDLVVKNFDWPGADAIAERIKRSLPPNLTDEGKADEEQQRMQAQALAEQQQQIQEIMLQLEIERKERENDKMYADSLLSIAKAEAAEVGKQIQEYKATLDALAHPAVNPQAAAPQEPVQPAQPQPMEAQITPEMIDAMQQGNMDQMPEY